ncbi:MAG TPA: enoyl-CoA hydratase/isomerase family protein [Luteimonas sp.]|nr:enoyl-CoA hydratase/isomerase family protein [Luteimonas sp.]
MTTLIKRTDHGDIRELQLDRAPVNALNPMLCAQLVEALRGAVADGVGGVVLSGGPKVFSAGLDVPFLLALPDRGALTEAWEQFFIAARELAACPVPVAAAVNGHAPAGGCVLALCCDYRVMASGPYRIGLNETQVGLAAPEGIQRLMRRVIGAHRAERLLVSGEMVEAGEALALGLVDELTGIDEVPARALAWLQQLLQLPRKPVLATRAIARADVVAALQPECIRLDRFVDAWSDPDTQAGLRALVARLGK